MLTASTWSPWRAERSRRGPIWSHRWVARTGPEIWPLPTAAGNTCGSRWAAASNSSTWKPIRRNFVIWQVPLIASSHLERLRTELIGRHHARGSAAGGRRQLGDAARAAGYRSRSTQHQLARLSYRVSQCGCSPLSKGVPFVGPCCSLQFHTHHEKESPDAPSPN